MAVTNISDQLLYVGKGYLDSKIQPVNTPEDLKLIPSSQRFIGLNVTVLNDGDGNIRDYILIGGTKNSNWKPRTYIAEKASIPITGDDVE